MIRKLGLILTAIVLLLLAYAFLAGPLFPYAPFSLGYERIAHKRTNVLAYHPHALPAYYGEGDQMLAAIEAHFGLMYRKPVYILAMGTKREFKRTVPWLNAEVIGAAALETGDIVLVNREKISETVYEEREFVVHELVHALQFQNSRLRHTITMHKQIWMREGVAVHFGGPTYYATPADYRIDYLRYKPAINPDTSAYQIWLNVPAGGGKFSYTFYGNFISYLTDTYGLPAFQDFFARYLANPKAVRQHAQAAFGLPLPTVQEDFLALSP